mmetsp:Transcript_27023/g.59584  ORF Transcript_27023/g.59584 Transcript_27023/m.59584 type:complete len:106 (-) Transcript_27023:194-511(-)
MLLQALNIESTHRHYYPLHRKKVLACFATKEGQHLLLIQVALIPLMLLSRLPSSPTQLRLPPLVVVEALCMLLKMTDDLLSNHDTLVDLSGLLVDPRPVKLLEDT